MYNVFKALWLCLLLLLKLASSHAVPHATICGKDSEYDEA